jgi:hypothetical protein
VLQIFLPKNGKWATYDQRSVAKESAKNITTSVFNKISVVTKNVAKIADNCSPVALLKDLNDQIFVQVP